MVSYELNVFLIEKQRLHMEAVVSGYFGYLHDPVYSRKCGVDLQMSVLQNLKSSVFALWINSFP